MAPSTSVAALVSRVYSFGRQVVNSPTAMYMVAALPTVLYVGAAALVPSAMTAYGLVVPGIGTYHAAGGVAATLQSLAVKSSVTLKVIRLATAARGLQVHMGAGATSTTGSDARGAAPEVKPQDGEGASAVFIKSKL